MIERNERREPDERDERDEGDARSGESEARDLEALRDLARVAPLEAPSADADRVHRRARVAFLEAHAYAGSPWRSGVARAWSRVFVPALLFATCVLYLTWAVRAASALYH